MVKVAILLDNSRIFLFPASVALIPGDSDSSPAPPDDTTVRGVVNISTETRARIGPVRVVWEVARELKTQTGSLGKRDVLATFQSQVTEDDTWLESGTTSLVFTFQIPSLLPPTCETVFDKTSHTLVASVLEAAPEYSPGPVPDYEDDESSLFPGSSSGPASNWSFPALDSRRSSLLTESDASREASLRSGRTSGSWSTVDSACTSRRTSFSDGSSPRPSVDLSSRHGSVEGLGGASDIKKKKRGLFGGFRRKDSTISMTSTSASSIARSSIAPPVKVPACEGIELADFLLPSTASSLRVLEIISCPAPKGEISSVDWTQKSQTTGLGRSEKYVHSNLLSLGSGVNFDYKLSEVSPKTTIHSIRLLMYQTTKAANGDSEEEVFTLFSRGSAGHHVWRGEEARTWDAQGAKPNSEKNTPRPALPQASVPGVVSGDASMRITTKLRLPTPIAGAVPTSPKLLDNRLARITHRLRVETLFSVLGEDDWGRPLPLGLNAKDGKPAEGRRRRTWVDHEIEIGSCCITPENVLVPTYSPAAEVKLDLAQEQARIEARTELASFEVPKTCRRTSPTSQSLQRSERMTEHALSRLARHAYDNDSRCLCFHGDKVVAAMVGSLEKPERELSAVQLSANIGEMVKSLYIPAEVQQPVDMRIQGPSKLNPRDFVVAY